GDDAALGAKRITPDHARGIAVKIVVTPVVKRLSQAEVAIESRHKPEDGGMPGVATGAVADENREARHDERDGRETNERDDLAPLAFPSARQEQRDRRDPGGRGNQEVIPEAEAHAEDDSIDNRDPSLRPVRQR